MMIRLLKFVQFVFHVAFAGTTARIVGGREADLTRYPFFTYLESDGVTNCGGSLIHPDIVLSAAHCWSDDTETIVARVNFTIADDDTYEQKRFVKSVVVHPDFLRPASQNDIMLMKLNSPVYNVEPVRLNDHKTIPKNLDEVTVIGAGILNEDDFSLPKRLQQVSVPVVPFMFCNGERSYNGILDEEVQFCAGSAGKDACTGDSGGPLLNTQGLQVGIVNYGLGCGEFFYPGVYTRTSAFLDWIERVTCYLTDIPCEVDESTATPSIAPLSSSSTIRTSFLTFLTFLMCCFATESC
jgi:secreted trypsin-like serine protease